MGAYMQIIWTKINVHHIHRTFIIYLKVAQKFEQLVALDYKFLTK